MGFLTVIWGWSVRPVHCASSSFKIISIAIQSAAAAAASMIPKIPFAFSLNLSIFRHLPSTPRCYTTAAWRNTRATIRASSDRTNPNSDFNILLPAFIIEFSIKMRGNTARTVYHFDRIIKSAEIRNHRELRISALLRFNNISVLRDEITPNKLIRHKARL